MGTSTKILRKVAAIIEGTPGTYQDPATLIPQTEMTIHTEYTPIEDKAIIGLAFKDLPVQGLRKILGTINSQLDVTACVPLLGACFGYTTDLNFALPLTKNIKSLAICGLDEVKTNKFGGVYCKKWDIKSSAGNNLELNMDVIGWTAELRDDTAFPAMSVVPGLRLVHHNCANTGTGYQRIGDQANALDSGDNLDLEEISFGCDWGFLEEYGSGQGILQPLSTEAEASFTFKVARHLSDAFLAWRDAGTALQAEIYWYKSAAANMKLQVPNFMAESVTVSNDPAAKVEVTARVARNGHTSGTYSNANMAFNAPLKLIVDNT